MLLTIAPKVVLLFLTRNLFVLQRQLNIILFPGHLTSL